MHDLNYCMPDLNYCMPDLNYCGITAELLRNNCGITAELLSNRLNYCMPEKIHRGGGYDCITIFYFFKGHFLGFFALLIQRSVIKSNQISQ